MPERHTSRAILAGTLGAASLVLSGCAAVEKISYHERAFIAVAPAVDESKRPEIDDSEIREVDKLGSATSRLFAEGYELVGYSQFISPLRPFASPMNTRAAAEAHGAELIVRLPPAPAKLNQHYYLSTYWHRVKPGAFLFGAYYDDTPMELLATISCHNLIAIDQVVPGTPAHRAGLRKADLIVSVDGKRIHLAAELDRALLAAAGSEVELGIVRAAKPMSVTVHLNPRTPETARASVAWKAPLKLGMALTEQPLPEKEQETAGRKANVIVTGLRAGHPACKAGLEGGDVIVEAGGKPVNAIDDVPGKQARDGRLDLTIERAGKQYEKVLDLDAAAQKETAATARLGLREATYGEPWLETPPEDWSVLAASLQLASAVQAEYVREQQRKREAAAAYWRSVVKRQSREPKVVDIRGRSYVRDTGGNLVQVNRKTAAMLRADPGLRVQTGGRGADLYLVQPNGSRERAPRSPTGHRTVATGGVDAGTLRAVVSAGRDESWAQSRYGQGEQLGFAHVEAMRELQSQNMETIQNTVKRYMSE